MFVFIKDNTFQNADGMIRMEAKRKERQAGSLYGTDIPWRLVRAGCRGGTHGEKWGSAPEKWGFESLLPPLGTPLMPVYLRGRHGHRCLAFNCKAES